MGVFKYCHFIWWHAKQLIKEQGMEFICAGGWHTEQKTLALKNCLGTWGGKYCLAMQKYWKLPKLPKYCVWFSYPHPMQRCWKLGNLNYWKVEILSKLRFQGHWVCASQQHKQNETCLAEKVCWMIKTQWAQDRQMKIKIGCKCSRVSGVKACCEWQGKCAAWGSGVKSLAIRKLGMKILWSP